MIKSSISFSDCVLAMKRVANPSKVKDLLWFFKTGKGEYGEGDKFLGITVPAQRKIARQFRGLPLFEVLRLLKSRYHEHRLTALFILVHQFQQGDDRMRQRIVDAYLNHTAFINNWDLVDSSAPHILGTWLIDRPRRILHRLSRSSSLWEKRISMLATQTLIRRGEFDDALKIARQLLSDSHDLLHKAAGWMLREIGDRDRAVEEAFLKTHALRMPRTMLRYAVEKFPEKRRQFFLRLR